jgi:hypothetical protein
MKEGTLMLGLLAKVEISSMKFVAMLKLSLGFYMAAFRPLWVAFFLD